MPYTGPGRPAVTGDDLAMVRDFPAWDDGRMAARLLVMLCGLPATGKSTVARELIDRDGELAYLRIDSIEQAMRDSGEMGPRGVEASGYLVGHAVAADLLRSCGRVLVECVNPFRLTRDAWRDVARTECAPILEVELSCSDRSAHRRRVEGRVVDVRGLEPPDWQAVRDREYEPWDGADLRIDTSRVAPGDAADLILAAIGRIDRAFPRAAGRPGSPSGTTAP